MSTQPQVLQDTPSKMKPLSSLRFFDPQTGQFVIRPKPFGDAEQVAGANPGWRVSFIASDLGSFIFFFPGRLSAHVKPP
jgi:hypothetical protein